MDRGFNTCELLLGRKKNLKGFRQVLVGFVQAGGWLGGLLGGQIPCVACGGGSSAGSQGLVLIQKRIIMDGRG